MSLLDSLIVVGETFRISAPTFADAILGRVRLEVCDERLESWSKRVVAQAQIDLHVSGAQVDFTRPYVVMSNHQSHIDIPVLFRVVRGRLRMITKKELFRIPVFGKAMRNAGFVEIDRSDRDKAIESLRSAEKLLAAGTHIWIAPEGTRSKDGRIGKMKKGGFVMAKATGLPILPIALRGTHDVLPKGTAAMQRGKRVDAIIGDPIDVSNAEVPQLMEQVRRFLLTYVEGSEASSR